MSFSTGGLTAWVNERKFGLLMQLQAKSGLAELVRKQTGIKSAARLHFLSTNATFQSDSCAYNASGSTPLTEKTLTVGDIAVMEDLCTKDLNGFWAEMEVGIGCDGEKVIPGMIEQMWMNKKINVIANQLAKADFQGDTGSGDGNLDKYDGLLKLVDADGTVITGNTDDTTSITSANVLTVLENMWKAVPDDLELDAPDAGNRLYLWLSISVYKLYIAALKNANLFHYKSEDGDVTLFGTDITLVPTTGLSGTQDRMILTYADNIVIGMDGDSEEDNMDVWYSQDDRITKSLICFKRGVQFNFGNYIVEFTRSGS